MFDFIMERLKLLDYHQLLLKDVKMRPISRYYFIKSTNPGEQFFMFISICAFCFRKIGKDFEQPQEFDDPTVLVTKILRYLEELNITIDFTPSKLMQGAGPNCLFIMDRLSAMALKINRPHLSTPEIFDDDEPIPEIMESANEIILEKLEEEYYFADDDDDDVDTAMLFNATNKGPADVLAISNPKNKKEEDNQSMSAEAWSLELERSLSQLKIVIKPDPRDWRSRWYQMKQYRDNINTLADETQAQLRKLQGEIAYVTDKIEVREKHLNVDLKPTITEYMQVSDEQAKCDLANKEIRTEINEYEKQLDKTVHAYKTVKDQMDQRGTSMSDGSQLINLKKAIAKIKDEIVQMNLEISVMQHGIDQDIIKQNTMFSQIKN